MKLLEKILPIPETGQIWAMSPNHPLEKIKCYITRRKHGWVFYLWIFEERDGHISYSKERCDKEFWFRLVFRKLSGVIMDDESEQKVKVYNIRKIIDGLNNAFENGYEKLDMDDIRELLAECETDCVCDMCKGTCTVESWDRTRLLPCLNCDGTGKL